MWVCPAGILQIPRVCGSHQRAPESEHSSCVQQTSSKASASASSKMWNHVFQLDLLPAWTYSLASGSLPDSSMYMFQVSYHEAYMAFNVLQASDIIIKSTRQEENENGRRVTPAQIAQMQWFKTVINYNDHKIQTLDCHKSSG